MLPLDESKLKQYLTKYQTPDTTRRDVMNALEHYHGLTPKFEPYVFNDGSCMDLLNLNGTIPVSYKGNTYNIPICIWLMDTHPNNAPLCYVMPTPDMHIKVSMYVDHNGKIYLPYLHDWVPYASDLLGLIQVMIVTFGEHPPVYAKPRTESGSTPYPTTSFMPQPGNSAYPPYPTSSTGYQPPVSNYGGYHAPYPPVSSGSNFPPYPAFGYGQFPPFSGGGYPPNQPSSTPTSTSGQSGTISEEHIRASLLSAVEDKLKRRLREQFSQNQAELETLRRTQQELMQGKSKLADIFVRLEKEQAELDKNITILQDKEQELDKAIERLADEESIDVDEAVTTTAPLYKQLLNAFAEEAATEDAIYYMGEALRSGVIDLDVFLKQVRTLSRKQFMLRALMQKCRQKAGLAG